MKRGKFRILFFFIWSEVLMRRIGTLFQFEKRFEGLERHGNEAGISI